MKKAKPTYTTVPWKSLDDPDKFGKEIPVEEENSITKMEVDYRKLLDDAAEASKLAEKENEELKAELAREKEDHQFDNLVHKRELEKMNK